DPVENASFMPWLVGTALIHSLAVTDKRGLFKSWTLLLAILAFSLSMLGTFLVRSGVLVSVHSFAADPTRGIFILAFLVLMIGGALALYTWRAPLLKSPAGFELGARESFLLFNNVLLVIAAATVFAGTLAPLISDALKLGTVSVGPPYFNPTFMLSMLPLLALLSVGVHANWKRGRLQDKQRTLLYTLIAGAALACGAVFGIYSHGRVLTPVGATRTVTRNGAPLMVLKPEKRHYWVKGTEKTETSIKMHHGANILVALGEDLGAGRWSVRIQIRPLVSFIWLAALIMAIGGA